MTSLVNMIRQIARQEVEKLSTLELGVVETVNLHENENDVVNHDCSVLLKARTTPEGEPLKLESVPIATYHSGSVIVPYVNDLVLVSFINGNFAMPVIIGILHSMEKRAPLYAEGEHRTEFNPTTYRDKDNSDLDRKVMVFNGTNEDNEYLIEFKDGPSISYKPGTVEITTGETSVKMTMDDDIEINGANNLKIDVKSNIEIKASGDIKIEASGNVDVKGSKINLN